MFTNALDREIKEYFDGFSIRKNLIIKTSELSNIDKIIDYCSRIDRRVAKLHKIDPLLFEELMSLGFDYWLKAPHRLFEVPPCHFHSFENSRRSFPKS